MPSLIAAFFNTFFEACCALSQKASPAAEFQANVMLVWKDGEVSMEIRGSFSEYCLLAWTLTGRGEFECGNALSVANLP